MVTGLGGGKFEFPEMLRFMLITIDHLRTGRNPGIMRHW